MRIGSVVYNTVYHPNSAFAFKPGTLFVVTGQASNGGLHGIPTFLIGEPLTDIPVLDPTTFHRVDDKLEKTIQEGYELEKVIADYGKKLPNPNPKLSPLAQTLMDDLEQHGIVGEEDEDGVEEELDYASEDEEEED